MTAATPGPTRESDRSAEPYGSEVTRMSGFWGPTLKNSSGFRVLLRPAPILLYWTIWSTFAFNSGCVLPVSPEFQPTPAAPNYPPAFVRSEPFAETTVSAHPQTFTVEVVDPNPADKLYVRWVSDYPPFTARSRLLVDDVEGRPQGPPISFEGSRCEKFAMGMEHELVVIVSDRKFRPYDQFTSDFRFNLVEGGGTPIMMAWDLVNCP